ncbi:nucleotidyltransferase domain-containing protein [Ralstonia pseudosolanacearum]|uniref:nucleotidyltransferase family protein n=1 Tax=Ralstonia pseudosolanacearum TaxID=1310165 RepID=UPI002676562C|nr:nucleotidyltransferase domain-containing protein [Ralstonia pseudosolanacearum]MDO3515185.1 nucleotidyltransferase domain-containing protein [Ralstonia pseudosolanacearum]MDO3634007.1 nucleotidyltransferase domain-containing protein [Ralstonia pseudosolanacearum]
MGINEIRNIVTAWAETQPLVLKVWLFGSRVRRTERPDSDIDIAVEVETRTGDSSAWTTFIFEADGLTASIQSLLPMKVQLEWYGGPVETPTIHAGLQASSMLVYEAT